MSKRYHFRSLLTALFLCATLAASSFAQSRVQIIHNSADPAIERADVYVNGSRLVNDIRFRRATAFQELPSQETVFAVTRGSSSGADDAVGTLSIDLRAGRSYVVIFTGVLTPGEGFTGNPESLDTSFRIVSYNNAREESSNPNRVDILSAHGVTDIGNIDFEVRPDGLLEQAVSFGGVGSSYRSRTPLPLTFDLRDHFGRRVVAAFEGDISEFAGQAMVLLTSGFRFPVSNSNGESIAMLAVFPNGDVRVLPETGLEIGSAKAQFIHASADPELSSVDIYLNGELALDDFSFQTASTFTDVPAGLTANIAIAPSTSTSADQAYVVQPYLFQTKRQYAIVVRGVTEPSEFLPNPSGRFTNIGVVVADQGVEDAIFNTNRVFFNFVHAATDAPALIAVIEPTLEDPRTITSPGGSAYSSYTGYTGVLPGVSNLRLAVPSDPEGTYANYALNWADYVGRAATLVATGFVDVNANKGGEVFRVFAAFGNGDVESPIITTSGEGDLTTPSFFELDGNYPNPFNPVTNLSVDLSEPSMLSVAVFDLIGRRVMEIPAAPFAAGAGSVRVDASGLESGVYLYEVTAVSSAGSRVLSGQMTLIK